MVRNSLAPANTPAPLVAELNTRFVAALGTAAVRARLTALGLDATPSTPEAFTRFIETEMVKWAAAARAANVQMD